MEQGCAGRGALRDTHAPTSLRCTEKSRERIGFSIMQTEQTVETGNLQHFANRGVGIADPHLSSRVLEQLGRDQNRSQTRATHVIELLEIEENLVVSIFHQPDQLVAGLT